MKVVGVTGRIGTGKSTLTHSLVPPPGFRLQILDADKICHELYSSDPRLRDSLVEEFGPAVIDRSNPDKFTIDRTSLGKMVFGNPSALGRLTAIVWPAIKEVVAQRLQQIRNLEGRRGRGSVKIEDNSPPLIRQSPPNSPAADSPLSCNNPSSLVNEEAAATNSGLCKSNDDVCYTVTSADNTDTEGTLARNNNNNNNSNSNEEAVETIAIIDAAVLIEASWHTLAEYVIILDCKMDELVRRVIARNPHLTAEDVKKRIESQWTVERCLEQVKEDKIKYVDVLETCRALDEVQSDFYRLMFSSGTPIEQLKEKNDF